MDIGGYSFCLVCTIRPEKDENGRIKIYAPQALFLNERSLPLNKYGAGPFCKFKIPRSYTASGLYALQIASEVTYIGECRDLSARYNMGYGNISPRNCYKGGQETNCRLNNLIYLAASEGHEVSLWFHETVNFKVAELQILSMKKWLWNRR